MGLKEDVKKRLEEQLDYERGGHLRAIVNKAAILDQPVLVIGLGGTGVDGVIRTKKMIYDRINCKGKDGKWQDKPDNVEYLAIDTDEVNADVNIDGMSFNRDLEEFFIFKCADVGAILKSRDKFLSPHASEWLSDELPISSVINGAGGVRQAGRLMLFLNNQVVINAIRNKIKRVTLGRSADTPVYVFLLAGISGGTGSGTFIDIAYIIKELVKEVRFTMQSIGMLFMPDVSLSHNGIAPAAAMGMKSNGFAALKELDFLMNMESSGDTYEQQYNSEFKVAKTKDAPFNQCILMSTKDKMGRTFDHPYEYIMNVAAETVVNFVANENLVGGQYTINSYLSNYHKNITAHMALLNNQRKPVNYVYDVVGASSALLPVDDLMSYLTYMMFEDMDKQYHKEVTDAEVDELMGILKVDLEAVKLEFSMNMPVRPDFSSFTFDRIKKNPEALVTEYLGSTNAQKKYLTDFLTIKLNAMGDYINESGNIIESMFQDLSKGPVYTQRILFSTGTMKSVCSEIEQLKNRVLAEKFDSTQIDFYDKEMKYNLEAILNKGLLESKNKLRERFIESCDTYYDALRYNHFMDVLYNTYTGIYRILMDKNNAIYDAIAELLNTLKRLFKKYGDIGTQTSVKKTGNVTTFSWNLIDPPQLIQEIKSRMAINPDLQIDFEEVVSLFYRNLIEHKELWTGKTREDIVDSLNEYISKSFAKVINKSMDYYLEFVATQKGKSVEEFCRDITDDLSKAAMTMFPFKSVMGGVGAPSLMFRYMSVPYNTVYMSNAANKKGAGSNNFVVKESKITERAFMFNCEQAIALYTYTDINDYENAYEASLGTKGIHLYEKNKDWKMLPSPNGEATWTTDHTNPREAQLNKGYREVFDKALKYGYIIWDEKAAKYQCMMSPEIIDYNQILKMNAIDFESSFASAQSAKKASTMLRETLEDQTRLTQRVYIYDAIFVKDGITPDEEYSKDIFIKMVGVRDQIKTMTQNHEECLTILKKLKEIGGNDLHIRNYIRALYCNLVFRSRMEYKFRDKEGAAQSLYVFNGAEDQYKDFYVLKAFSQLDKTIYDTINVMAEKMHKTVSDEEYAAMQERLSEYISNLQTVLEELNDQWNDVDQGKEKLELYRNLLSEAKKEYALIK